LHAYTDDSRFQAHLIKGETIHWTDQPRRDVVFTGTDVFLVPFSLLWGGFAIYWELTSIQAGAPTAFSLFGIPFVIFGLYFILGRFLYKDFKKRHTYYAVTNKRVLVITSLWRNSFQEAKISELPSIKYSERRNGVGTIIFQGKSGFLSMFGNYTIYQNTGMDFFGPGTLSFFDIDNVQEVYLYIQQQREKVTS
jgi:hypothetical protein